jgi:hypothetical protein
MIVVEVGHAHVITFLQLSCELSFCQCHCHFLGEKCGDEVFIIFYHSLDRRRGNLNREEPVT